MARAYNFAYLGDFEPDLVHGLLKLLTWFDGMLIYEFYYGFWIRSGYCHESRPMWAKVRS